MSLQSRTARYRARMRAKGFIQTKVWVPVDLVDKIQEEAATLRGDTNATLRRILLDECQVELEDASPAQIQWAKEYEMWEANTR